VGTLQVAAHVHADNERVETLVGRGLYMSEHSWLSY
jgi:hypothetical protein